MQFSIVVGIKLDTILNLEVVLAEYSTGICSVYISIIASIQLAQRYTRCIPPYPYLNLIRFIVATHSKKADLWEGERGKRIYISKRAKKKKEKEKCVANPNKKL